MPDIEARTIINATPSVVRGVFLDFTKYSEWSTFIKEISPSDKQEGPVPGKGLQVLLDFDGGSPQKMAPIVITNSDAEFSWTGVLGVKSVFNGTHKFEFKPLEDGTKTELVQSETFGGVLRKPLLWYVGKKTQAGFEAFNKALKDRVENSA
ncbi:hypothetical protein KDRO_D04300 [Kluyveromyces lactis]|nr:hypothetical protein KDRO_D04300 [Kluyveromyces lactis]